MQQFETKSSALLVRAPAKINLCLLVTGKRPDGFHGLRTIMAKVDWYDHLLFEKAAQPGIELVCTGPHWAPTGPENLVLRAINLLCSQTGHTPQCKVTLTKNIPAGSGLGSASSDAAAALLGYTRFANINVSTAKLMELAAQLGSDVPFFLGSPLALCEGRGEILTPLDQIFSFTAILILPNINTSTKRVYEKYSHQNSTFELLNSQFQLRIEQNRLDLVAKMCTNMLEDSCFCLHPEIAELKAGIEHLGITPVCLSGSGSTLFHIIVNDCSKKALNTYRSTLKDTFGCDSVIVNSNNW